MLRPAAFFGKIGVATAEKERRKDPEKVTTSMAPLVLAGCISSCVGQLAACRLFQNQALGRRYASVRGF